MTRLMKGVKNTGFSQSFGCFKHSLKRELGGLRTSLLLKGFLVIGGRSLFPLDIFIHDMSDNKADDKTNDSTGHNRRSERRVETFGEPITE